MTVNISFSLEVAEFSKEAFNLEHYVKEWTTLVDFPYETLDFILGLSERKAVIKEVTIDMDPIDDVTMRTDRVVSVPARETFNLELYLKEDPTGGAKLKD